MITEAQMLDEDFVEALEYGMPPAFGFGFSRKIICVFDEQISAGNSHFPADEREIIILNNMNN